MAHPALFSPARRERDVGRRAPLLLAIAVCLASAAPAEAQLVEGRVLDAGSGEAVATARVTLVTADDDRVATTLTDAEGHFLLRAEEGGAHLLEADRLGYGLQRSGTFEVDPEGVTQRDFRLASDAVEVEGIVVEGYAGQLLHESTLSGVYARRARSPSVGSNRVLVRGDPDLDSQWRVRDVLPAWIPGRACDGAPFVFWNGRDPDMLGAGAIDFILDLPVREVEAVEYYRDIAQAPIDLRPFVWSNRRIRACGIVGVWSRGAPR